MSMTPRWGVQELFYVYKDNEDTNPVHVNLVVWCGTWTKMKTLTHLYTAHRRGHREGRKDEFWKIPTLLTNADGLPGGEFPQRYREVKGMFCRADCKIWWPEQGQPWGWGRRGDQIIRLESVWQELGMPRKGIWIYLLGHEVYWTRKGNNPRKLQN